MPRASLPARTSTPKTRTPGIKTFHSLRKRKSPTPPIEPEPILPEDSSKQAVENDPEADLEAWQDFAAEHYEMVEQLPLELHRNYRLLRELDDGCAAQTSELQVIIREYIALRLPLPITNDNATIPAQDTTLTDKFPTPPPKPSTTLNPEDIANPQPEVQSAGDMGAPISDGQGGLILPDPAILAAKEDILPRLPFPAIENKAEETPVPPITVGQSTEAGVQAESSAPDRTGNPKAGDKRKRASDLLPEIGRLAREIVRSCEEKVAVAAGAYNSIDRHIRALDSALSAEEISLVLGLRSLTQPSAQVDGFGEPELEEDMLGLEDENGGLTIGIGGGGGGARRRGKKGRAGKKGRKAEEKSEEKPGVSAVGVALEGLEVDPNEPIYCYCRLNSYGAMVGCENEDCPIEWFHLPCVGLVDVPAGKWFCLECRPKVGLSAAGAGSTKVAGKHKKRKKIT